jgi:putative Mn2+ efflux pump MntP
MLLSLATSMDALAVGLSIALLKVPVLFSVVMIGLTSSLLSSAGIFAGARLGEAFGKRMRILGGLILVGIGVRIVVSHLWP